MIKIKNNKGITLIALVITIIVLVILAGITISMLTGENGILLQAAKAKEETEKTQEEEQLRLAQMEAATNLEGITHTETINLEGTNNEVTVKIPAGFTKSPRENEQSVETGLVIIDSNGNEYVWIPVFTNDQVSWGVNYSSVTSEDDWEGIQTALKTYTATYTFSSNNDEWYGDANYGQSGYNDSTGILKYYTNGNMTKEEYETLYHNMLKSIYKNGGFYIGRYEMGIEVVDSIERAQKIARTEQTEYKASSDNTTNEAPTIEGMSKPLSKANAVPYNHITQSQAQMLAESLNYSSVESSIMFGVQWDIVCVFIEHLDTKNTAPTKSQWLTDNNYSKLWGNYSNATFKMDRGFYSTTYSSNPVTWNNADEKTESGSWLCTTGASDQNSSLNIYDFGGNLYEWTLEMYRDPIHPFDTCLGSGGNFRVENSAYDRNALDTCYSSYDYSARFSLFI